ncbi:MAG: SDR family NAD(P)-dependent oxidoreductase [Acidobacteria bacterium]|nr:SDR family NAD(P)-dependent oxidoreductase [Acidobacteriota bacterium]
MRLEGKVVLITGASGGIGAACAAAFQERGAWLSLTARSEDRLQAVGAGKALVTAGDITDPTVRRRVVERTLDRYGRIDVLVNNAGCGLYRPTAEVPMGEVERLFALNFFAPLEMIQLALPGMKKQRAGVIVNVSSIGGRIPLPWLTVYSASKYAICALTDGLRMELKSAGIHTMAVCPGYVKTGFHEHALGDKAPERIVAAKARAITPEKCARDIVRGLERDARTVVTPAVGWLLIALERLLPSFVDNRMAAINGTPWTSD